MLNALYLIVMYVTLNAQLNFALMENVAPLRS